MAPQKLPQLLSCTTGECRGQPILRLMIYSAERGCPGTGVGLEVTIQRMKLQMSLYNHKHLELDGTWAQSSCVLALSGGGNLEAR
jgi:hypothetical protein